MSTLRSLRLSLAPIKTRTTSSNPSQPSLLHQQMTPSSPPTPRLKSPAFCLTQTTTTASNSTHYQNITPLLPSPTPTLPVRPTSPLAWTWRCHLCHTTYRLGTTRRCLLDGHYFCSHPPPPPPASPEKLIPPPRLGERKEYRESPDRKPATKEADKGHIKSGRRKKKNSRKPIVTCTTAFDYLAWTDWNAWRRDLTCSNTLVPLFPSPAAATSRIPGLRSANRGEVVKMRKDCSADCDFPSECRWRCSSAYLEAVREELEEEEEGEGGGRI